MLKKCRQLLGPLLISFSLLGLFAAGCGGADENPSPRRRTPPINLDDGGSGQDNGGIGDQAGDDNADGSGDDNAEGSDDEGDGPADGDGDFPGDDDGSDDDSGDDGSIDPPTATVVGDDCQLGTQQDPSGSCDEGQVCADLDDTNNICTNLNCQSDFQCGQNGSSQNKCLEIGRDNSNQPVNACLRGCEPGNSSTCQREGFKCFSYSDGDICLPDCREPGNFCPQGLSCSATGECREDGTAHTYEECTGSVGCGLNDVCAHASAGGTSLCFQVCETPGQQSNCEAGSACIGSMADGTNFCLMGCEPQLGCPIGSTCEELQNGHHFCLPN